MKSFRDIIDWIYDFNNTITYITKWKKNQSHGAGNPFPPSLKHERVSLRGPVLRAKLCFIGPSVPARQNWNDLHVFSPRCMWKHASNSPGTVLKIRCAQDQQVQFRLLP